MVATLVDTLKRDFVGLNPRTDERPNFLPSSPNDDEPSHRDLGYQLPREFIA